MITPAGRHGKPDFPASIYGKNEAVNWLYLSPHLDDAVFSCGGLIWEQARSGQAVEVWTICAGDALPAPLSAYASSLHARWGIGPKKALLGAAALRREEDQQACQSLGAGYRHFPYPDAIYRRDPQDGKPLYTSEEDLFGPLSSVEDILVKELSILLERQLPSGWQLVCPLTLGNHVDHQLVRAAAERLGRPLWYYADLPYVLKDSKLPENLVAGMQVTRFPVSQAGLEAWPEAAAAYATQISTFWAGVEVMQAELSAYCMESGGVPLWRRE